MASEKVTTPGSQNLACLVRLYSGGQWTIAEAKLASSLCIEINRRFPFPLCYFIPRLKACTHYKQVRAPECMIRKQGHLSGTCGNSICFVM